MTKEELEAAIAARKGTLAAQPRERAAWLVWDEAWHKTRYAELGIARNDLDTADRAYRGVAPYDWTAREAGAR